MGFWAFAIICCHMLLATFQYIIPYRNYRPILRWAGLGLVVFSAVVWCISKKMRQETKQIFRSVRSFELAMLLGILLCFLLSCYVNGIGLKRPFIYFYAHDWFLFDSVVCSFLLFPLACAIGVKQVEKPIEVFMHVAVIPYTIFTAICLWHIFHLEVIDFPSGEHGGMTESVQLMLGFHYNVTGMIATTLFCLCVYMIFTQNLVVRVLYILLGIIQLVVVYLCNSRTIFVAVWVFIMIFAFFGTWRLAEKRGFIFRMGASIAVCAGCATLFWAGRTGMFILFERVTHFSEELAKERGEISFAGRYYVTSLVAGRDYFIKPLTQTGAESARKLTDLSNRMDVWKAAFKVMFSSPKIFFFGVTPAEITDSIWEIGNYHREKVAHAHNILLQIGTGMGVPAMVMFFLFLVSLAIRSVRVMLGKYRSKMQMKKSYLIPASVLCFVLIDMAEVYLLTRFSVIGCFFFLFAGWIVAVDRKRDDYVAEDSATIK